MCARAGRREAVRLHIRAVCDISAAELDAAIIGTPMQSHVSEWIVALGYALCRPKAIGSKSLNTSRSTDRSSLCRP